MSSESVLSKQVKILQTAGYVGDQNAEKLADADLAGAHPERP